MQYIWLMLTAALGSTQSLLVKKYSAGTNGIRSARIIYNWINVIASCVFYGASVGFMIKADGELLFYSALYAALVVISNFYHVFVHTKVSLAKVTLFSSAGALVTPYIADVCFFGGSVTVNKTAAVLLLTVIFILPFFDKNEQKGAPREYIYCTALFLMGGIGTVICKLFTLSENPLGNKLFCFWTNVLMIPILFVILMLSKDRCRIFADTKTVGAKGILTVVIVSFIGAVASPIMLSVMGEMNVTVYTIVSSSLSLIFAAVISLFVFRERVEWRTVVGIILSICAVVLSAV